MHKLIPAASARSKSDNDDAEIIRCAVEDEPKGKCQRETSSPYDMSWK
jgi:hypothetical protein